MSAEKVIQRACAALSAAAFAHPSAADVLGTACVAAESELRGLLVFTPAVPDSSATGSAAPFDDRAFDIAFDEAYEKQCGFVSSGDRMSMEYLRHAKAWAKWAAFKYSSTTAPTDASAIELLRDITTRLVDAFPALASHPPVKKALDLLASTKPA